MITTCILLPLMLPTSLNQVQESESTPAQRTAEDIEVLRRLLVSEIGNRPQDATVEGSTLFFPRGQHAFGDLADVNFDFSASNVPHSRAFHIPGQGVFFSLDVRVPVTEAQAEESEEPIVERSEAEKEWEVIREEVRTGVSARLRLHRKGIFSLNDKDDNRNWELDPKAITEIEGSVLRTLARHAARVEGLDNQELVTVALHLSGSDSSFLVRTESDDEERTTSIGWLSGAIAARRVAAQRLVIQVSMADLRRGDLNGGSKLRQSALIHSY